MSAGGERRLHPVLGPIRFPLRGCMLDCVAMPQALWHFERAAAQARALAGEARLRFEALVRAAGGEAVLAIWLARPIRRENHVLVVG